MPSCTILHSLPLFSPPTKPPQGVATVGEGAGPSEAEAELQREVEELKLRLHMAAEHYKEKYRECQRLRRQVAKLTSGEGVSTGGRGVGRGRSYCRWTDIKY